MSDYAIIHVRPDPNTDAWPVVERTRGGWQSGEHHYPAAEVLDVRPLVLVDAARLAELDRLLSIERAAQEYVMAGLCGNPDTREELAALIEVARTDR